MRVPNGTSWLASLLLLSLPAASIAQEPEVPPVVEAPDSTPSIQAAPVGPERAATDNELEQALRGAFTRIPGLASLQVDVEAGVVRLSGTVIDQRTADEAITLAQAREGTLVVLDRIEISTSLNERLRPTWTRLRDFVLELLVQGPLIIVALLIIAAAWLVGRLVRSVRLPEALTSRNPFLHGLIQRFLQAAILLAGVLVALDLLNAVALVGALAGTAGLAGLTLGFAFKDIVENYLAGILMSLRQPFAARDHVVVDGQEGKVIRLTWRDTILMTLDGNHLRIPNAKIFGSTVLNYTRNPLRRLSFDFGVGPADDLVEARRVGMETLGNMASVLKDPPPQALAMELGDSSVQMRFLAWVDQREHSPLRTRSEAIRLVKLALEDADITLPSPEYRVVVANAARVQPEPVRSAESRMEEDTDNDWSVDRQITEEEAGSSEENLLVG